MSTKRKMTKPNPIATELAHLMLGGFRVEIDSESIVLSGAGTVLLPETHDVKKVVVGEARYSDLPDNVVGLLDDAMSLISDPPTAAIYTRIKKRRRVLILVVDISEVLHILDDYIDLWIVAQAIDNWEVLLFTALDDGTEFSQVDLEYLYNERTRED